MKPCDVIVIGAGIIGAAITVTGMPVSLRRRMVSSCDTITSSPRPPSLRPGRASRIPFVSGSFIRACQRMDTWLSAYAYSHIEPNS